MSEQFSGWAIVEVMGHNKYIGLVEETTLAGAGVLRVDVPEVPGCGPGRSGIRAFTKYIPPASLYALTPVTEEEAGLMIQRLRSTPHNLPMITADPWVEGQEYHPYQQGDDDPDENRMDDHDDELRDDDAFKDL